jgi:Lhr-like helicase
MKCIIVALVQTKQGELQMDVIKEKNTRFALAIKCPVTGDEVSAETLYNRACEALGHVIRDHIGDLIFDNLVYGADKYCDDAALDAAVYAWAKAVRAEIAA